MASLHVIQSSLADYVRVMVQERVHELIRPLSSEQLWQRPFPYGNSIGTLILHVTGNLNYYIGAQIARTGYVRHRDLEFTDSGKPKGELLKAFDDAIQVTVATIESQSNDDWSTPYQAERARWLDPICPSTRVCRPRLSPRGTDHLSAKGDAQGTLDDRHGGRLRWFAVGLRMLRERRR